MAKYFIFRHGETFATIGGVGYGLQIFTAPILEEGKPVIKKLAEYLKDKPSDFNVSSQIRRCRQTSHIVTEVTGKEFVYDGRLNEYFIESRGRFLGRVSSLLKEIEEKECKSVLICTHGAVIAALIHLLTGQKMGKEFNIHDFPTPGVLTIIEDNRLEQVNFN